MNHILICTCEDSKCIRTQMVWRLNEWFQKINILRLEKNMLQFDVIFFSLLFLSQQKMNPLNGSNLNPHICMHNSNCNFMRLFLIDDSNGKSPAVRPHEQASSVLNYAFCAFLSIFRKVIALQFRWRIGGTWMQIVRNALDKPWADESVWHAVHHLMFPSWIFNSHCLWNLINFW